MVTVTYKSLQLFVSKVMLKQITNARLRVIIEQIKIALEVICVTQQIIIIIIQLIYL